MSEIMVIRRDVANELVKGYLCSMGAITNGDTEYMSKFADAALSNISELDPGREECMKKIVDQMKGELPGLVKISSQDTEAQALLRFRQRFFANTLLWELFMCEYFFNKKEYEKTQSNKGVGSEAK